MKKTRIEQIAYHPDSAGRLAGLAEWPWCAFLDSGFPYIRQGRYDVLAADPYLRLLTVGKRTQIIGATQTIDSGGDPFALLNATLRPFAGAGDARLPFTGGALGYFSYDLGRRIERLPELAERDIDMPDMAVGIYDWAVTVDHGSRQAWLVGHGNDERTFDQWETIREAVEPRTYVPEHRFEVRSDVRSNFDQDAYAAAFSKIKRYIREGDCYQVNLAQRFSARACGESLSAYLKLRAMNPAPFSAFLNYPFGAVLSSSPERFLKVQDGRVETKPIKGTRPRSASPDADKLLAMELQSSLKDRAENLMIVDLLRNDLGKNCAIGSVRVPLLFDLESYATVHHLVSTVTGELAAGKSAVELLAGCFPGGSITGAPKLRAMEIIEELEPHRRSVYCGAIGYIGFDGGMDTNIAIRTLVYHDGLVYLWAGGGIVMDSVLEQEYRETFDKAKAMLQLLEQEKSGVAHVGG